LTHCFGWFCVDNLDQCVKNFEKVISMKKRSVSKKDQYEKNIGFSIQFKIFTVRKICQVLKN